MGSADVDIYDPVAGFSYRVDSKMKTAYSFSKVDARANSVQSYADLPPETLPDLLPMPAVMLSSNGNVIGPKPDWQRRSLGTKTLEGLTVLGSQIIVEVPQAWNGFDQAFQVSVETWRSDELDMIVLWKRVDPRSGRSTWKLINVNRAAPSPDLFHVPHGYSVVPQS